MDDACLEFSVADDSPPAVPTADVVFLCSPGIEGIEATFAMVKRGKSKVAAASSLLCGSRSDGSCSISSQLIERPD